MTTLRIAGPQIGSSFSAGMTVDGQTSSATIPAFRDPAIVSGLPRISDAFDDGMLTLDETGLTGITARQWRIFGGGNLGTEVTQAASAASGGDYVTCEITCDQGTCIAPAVMVYGSAHMGMTMMGSHRADDAAIVALVPHAQATHIAVADGSWSDPATWLNGRIPRNGARPLIPQDRTVIYDNAEANVRLDRLRVDGTLTWATDQSTRMLVDTVVGTRGSRIIIGTASNRLPSQYTAEIVISGRDYSLKGFTSSDLSAARDEKLWSRGLISQGLLRIWGNKKTTWMYADPIDAGATSLTLRDTPVDWKAGDTIVIGGTLVAVATKGAVKSLDKQDETRVLTGVSGNTLTWSDPLDHPHKNQLAGSTRTDLYPVVMMKRGKNVTVRSEVTNDEPRRGHVAMVHHHSMTDVWDAEFIDLGRTDKSFPSGLLRKGNTELFTDNPGVAGRKAEPKTARSNVFGRYSFHFHHVGLSHSGSVPVLNNCYAEGSPGHLFVHHSSDVEIVECAGHDFFGCAFVGEQGNEAGVWRDCLALGTSFSFEGNILGEPKNLESEAGRMGDNFRHGYGFGYRGRFIRVPGCVSVSCTYGHVFFHRADPNFIQDAIDFKRANLPLKTPGFFTQTSLPDTDFEFVDFPIFGFADAEAIACLSGLFVSKSAPKQRHDVNVHLKRFKSWGWVQTGAKFEYIGTYLADDFDIVAGYAGVGLGISWGTNVFQAGTARPNTEGCNVGVSNAGGETLGFHDNFDSVTNPRWYSVGHSSADDSTVSGASSSPMGSKSGPDVYYEDFDWNNLAVDYSADPTETLPLEVAVWNGASFLNSKIDNTAGGKNDNISTGTEIVTKPYDDNVIDMTAPKALAWSTRYGYWQYGGNDVLVISHIISDRATARPAKVAKMVRCTGSFTPPGTNRGTYSYSTAPVTGNDMTVRVAVNGTAVVDVIADSLAAGGNGATYALDALDYLPPDHGRASLNGVTGEVTFTPDSGYGGSDEMFVFVESGGQYKTIRISFLIGGSGGGLTAPVVGTHFAASDHANANTLAVALMDPPDTDGRRILYTQYSTDGGTTWRRVCNGWIKAVHKITVQSNGAAIASTGYGVRLRYGTDCEYATSTASADDAVTIS